jgi:hypothetical protein
MSRKTNQIQGDSQMKVVLTRTMCGPGGNAYPGMVLDIPKDSVTTCVIADKEVAMPTGEYMVNIDKSARQFDPACDSKRKSGLVRPEK